MRLCVIYIMVLFGGSILLSALSHTHAYAQTQGFTSPLNQASPLTTLISRSQPTNKRLPHEHSESSPQSRPANLSRLEHYYYTRTGAALKQFAYDHFRYAGMPPPVSFGLTKPLPSMPRGAVQDGFILNAGDTLEVIFEGQRKDRGRYTISSSGLLPLPDLPPIQAAGRSLGMIRADLDNILENSPNTKAYISLHEVSQIGVLVLGEVQKPGKQTTTVYNTVIDALLSAGGVSKTGSLRQIKRIRNGTPETIDFYTILTGDDPGIDLNLRDGDRIIVPPIQDTIAITGAVQRPGIYETSQNDSDSNKVEVQQLIALAGGFLSDGRNRILRLSPRKNGSEDISDITTYSDVVLHNGDIFKIERGQDRREDMIELKGFSPRAGLYAAAKTGKLSDLLSSKDTLTPQTYSLLGFIEREAADGMTLDYIAFSPTQVASQIFDLRLQPRDAIHLFSKADIETIMAAAEDTPNSQPLKSIPLPPELIRLIQSRSLHVRGAVLKPGLWPISDQENLDEVLREAGGLSPLANKKNVEITSHLLGHGHQSDGRSGVRRLTFDLTTPANTPTLVGIGDSIRVNPRYKTHEGQSVRLIGEVVTPGNFDLIPGETYSSLIRRAGGYTGQAYPEGVILSRRSERDAEEMRYKNQATKILQTLSLSLQADNSKISPGQIAEAQALAKRLSDAKGIGRITLETNLGSLEAAPDLDIYLEGGDVIYVPKRSQTVRVYGEVLSPATLQFRNGKKARTYIEEAGGFTYHADEDRSFVIYPDGSAQPLRVSAWHHTSSVITPGSTIVVPRDPKPFNFIESAKDISQILSNLAITGIFIDDVRDDD